MTGFSLSGLLLGVVGSGSGALPAGYAFVTTTDSNGNRVIVTTTDSNGARVNVATRTS